MRNVTRPDLGDNSSETATAGDSYGYFTRSMVSSDAELTTQQGADMLNVSRRYLVNLLEAGKIPFRLVGAHRRIRFDDLRAYQRRLGESGRAAADELSDLGQELGI